jgi:hypothetical protein
MARFRLLLSLVVTTLLVMMMVLFLAGTPARGSSSPCYQHPLDYLAQHLQ